MFRNVQGIEERLQPNIEFARPESWYPALSRQAVREAVDGFL